MMHPLASRRSDAGRVSKSSRVPVDGMPGRLTSYVFTAAPISVCRLLIIAFLASTHPASYLAAQDRESPQNWEDYADSRPFPTAHIRVPDSRLTDGSMVRSAFRQVVADARKATVRVRTDGRNTALGGIVGADGWILTKASRLPGEITCLLQDDREIAAEIASIDQKYDLALLKVDAKNLPTLKFSKGPVPEVGAWLATVGMDRKPRAIGVMSVEPRWIKQRAGTLGIQFDISTDDPVIEQVFPGTAAEEAGLAGGDVIISISGMDTPTRYAAIRRVQAHSPGQKITLIVRRGDETREIDARLKGHFVGRDPTREEFQNSLGSVLSQRRAGFPNAFQHDTVVKPSDCGGPIVDLDGEVVGFNLARAGRTETYAITATDVLGIIEKLKDEATR